MTAKKTANLEAVKEAIESPGADEHAFDDDVTEIVDIYGQLVELMEEADLSIKPTSDDVQGLASTVFIQRKKQSGYKSTPETVEFTPADELGKGFDTEKNKWVSCPKCGNSDIKHKKKDGSGSYFACKKCRIWLNREGETAPMDK